jgi:hypothetical protein
VLSISYNGAPARLNAAFLTVSAGPQLLLAYLIPAVLVPRFGPNFGFEVLVGVGLSSALMALCVRERFAPQALQPLQRIAWTPTVVLALLATLAMAAANGACWSYVGPLAAELGSIHGRRAWPSQRAWYVSFYRDIGECPKGVSRTVGSSPRG